MLKFASKLSRIAALEKILIAPLDWGLGHASRLVPIIHEQINAGHEVHLGCSGTAGQWLRQRFPTLPHHDLPGYGITYLPHHDFTHNMRRQALRIHTIQEREHRALKVVQQQIGFQRIISDNRYGLWHRDCENILITHQLFPQAQPLTAWLLRRYLHRRIARFDQCWVPDVEDEKNSLSGALSHGEHALSHVRFIGPLSRFQPLEKKAKRYRTTIMLSCPEPLRTAWEKHLIALAQRMGEPMALITTNSSFVKPEQRIIGALEVHYNADDADIASILASSEKVVCNAGYSTIMDMHAMGVRADVFATPGQTEQGYLMHYLASKNQVGYADASYILY